MSAEWLLTMKPRFLSEWMLLPEKEAIQVQKKLRLLTEDPTPDAKVKKVLTHHPGKPCRLRSGDYRIIYTYQKPYVSLLSIRKRDEGTYADDIESENLGGLDSELAPEPETSPTWAAKLDAKQAPLESKALPAPVTLEVLQALRVPIAHHKRLLGIATEDALLNCPQVPDDILLRIHEALVEQPIMRALEQPDLIAEDPDDLVRFKEGKLLGFLLKLSVEQEKLVKRGVSAGGPMLVKGGPGTGKSSVALYRVAEMLRALRKEGVETPRILFTTYTQALVRFSEQLIESLLGEDRRLVEVRTADSVVVQVLRDAGRKPDFVEHQALLELVREAGATATLEGTSLQKKAKQQALERLGTAYLLEEISSVIDARRLPNLDAYQEAGRPGRTLRLNRTQREAVWAARERLHALLDATGKSTWQQARADAAALVEAGQAGKGYDAVLIDEAQDLEPAALQVLVGLCKEPNRLFLTADANQSIYGAGFRWQDVHAWLRFSGRTALLKANYRSTRELGEAAEDYLASGEIDPDRRERSYAHSGPTPAVRAVATATDEAALLMRFVRLTSRELRLGVGSAAILVPTEKAGKRIAKALEDRGLRAEFMAGKDLDLKAKTVKVLTLKSAKGLEFPSVALAGFLDAPYPYLKKDTTAEEQEEILARERRTVFVAMTRAMRALLVAVPAKNESPLLRGFSPELWNLGGG